MNARCLSVAWKPIYADRMNRVKSWSKSICEAYCIVELEDSKGEENRHYLLASWRGGRYHEGCDAF